MFACRRIFYNSLSGCIALYGSNHSPSVAHLGGFQLYDSHGMEANIL